MCKILCVVYFSLLLFNIAESSDIQDDLIEDVKPSKHHHHHKPRTAANNVSKKKYDDAEANPTTTEEPKGNTEETSTEKLITDDNSFNAEELTPESSTEDNFRRSGHVPETVFEGSSTKPNQMSGDEYFSKDFDTQKFKAENVDRHTNEAEQINDTGDVLDSPDRKVFSQYPIIIDLKARSGHFHSEEVDPTKFENLKKDFYLPDVSNIGHSSLLSTNSKSRYGPIDKMDVIKPHENVQNYAHHLNHPISYSNNNPPQFKYPYNPRSEMAYNALLNYPRYSPLYFESLSSQELLYPILNNRENWSRENTGPRSKSYFDLSYPNKMLYNWYHDRCPQCAQGLFDPREPGLRRSEVETHTERESHTVLETDNSNPVEFDPSRANAYPLVLDKDVEDTNRVQSQNQAVPNEILNPVSKETSAQEIERIFQLTNIQSNTNFPKLFLPLPAYGPRNGSTLLRRLGLGGV